MGTILQQKKSEPRVKYYCYSDDLPMFWTRIQETIEKDN